MKAFIIDRTGREQGRTRHALLHAQLKSRDIRVKEWPKDGTRLVHFVMLAHWTDVSNDEVTRLRTAAAAGATVVYYSGGGLVEVEHSVGAGCILKMHWSTLQEVLGRVSGSSPASSVREKYRATRNRQLVDGLAVLSWCVSRLRQEPQILTGQSGWKSSPDKWRAVFGGCTREELLQACSCFGSEGVCRARPETVKAIDWIKQAASNGGPGLSRGIPDFARVFLDLKNTFETSA
jgi:hypothetical protein